MFDVISPSFSIRCRRPSAFPIATLSNEEVQENTIYVHFAVGESRWW